MKKLSIILGILLLISSTFAFAQEGQEEDVVVQEEETTTTTITTTEESGAAQKIETPQMQLSEEEDLREAPQQKGRILTIKKPQWPKAKGTAASSGDEKTKKDEVAFDPKKLKTNSHIEIIIDASGSMNGLMEQSTKLALLKSALKDVLTQPLPEGAKREVGLRVYGSQNPSEENICTDTLLLKKIGPVDGIEIRETIDSITALGVTPIGFALEEAAKDFEVSENTDNIIVLITDGEDSCDIDVCETAKKIHNSQKRIMINVIGFDLDQKASKSLSCIAKNGDGQFILSRGEPELRSSLDQILMANIPYNLRVQTLSGATPLPSKLVVYTGGTHDMVREDESSGIKYYQLPVGRYDIEVTYSDSKESPKPVKIIKGVEVHATSKSEQLVQFDLGMLTLKAFDQNGAPIFATYVLNKRENRKVGAKFDAPPGPYTVMLTRGTWTANVSAKTPEGLSLYSKAEGLNITADGATTHDFQFQVGKINIAGHNIEGEPVPMAYRVNIGGHDDKVILKGIAPKEGKTIEVTPGTYDLYFHASVENMPFEFDEKIPIIEKKGVEVGGGDTLEEKIEIPTAVLMLSSLDANNKKIETRFLIKPAGSLMSPTEMLFKEEKLSLILPPGGYDVVAQFVTTETDPPPTISLENLQITANQVLDKVIVFKFGTINLAGENSKGAPINTSFYVYQVGATKPVATLTNISYKTEVKLPEGYYDIRAEDLTSINDPKPNVWFHNVKVDSKNPVTETAVFTNGRVKLMCRGPNEVVLDCAYKLFAYGKDSPLFQGTTSDKWDMYDILPGNYYIEAGYHDAVDEVLLKKWITIDVGDNEMLEQIIRF